MNLVRKSEPFIIIDGKVVPIEKQGKSFFSFAPFTAVSPNDKSKYQVGEKFWVQGRRKNSNGEIVRYKIGGVYKEFEKADLVAKIDKLRKNWHQSWESTDMLIEENAFRKKAVFEIDKDSPEWNVLIYGAGAPKKSGWQKSKAMQAFQQQFKKEFIYNV